MKARVRILGITGVVLVASGIVMLSTAQGSEPEDPFWNVAGKRLEANKKATVKNVSGVETIIHGTIASKAIEVRCKTSALGSADIEGAAAKHDGKASGVLEMSECKLWANEGGTFKEEAGCEVPSIKSVTLTGALWLEGSKAAGGTTAVVVLEAKELTEKKEEIAKVVINNKEGCSTFAGTDLLEGKFAARLLPQNEEFTYIRWVLPSTAITPVWRPASEEGEESVSLTLGGSASVLQGELQVEPEGSEKIGGGIAPLAGIEAPFWGVNGERLGAGVEKEVETSTPENATLKGRLKGKEIEIRCSKFLLKEGRLIGSLGQMDGKFVVKTIEFAECRLFAIEGGKPVEQTKCEVPAFDTAKLGARLWLEGTKAERKTKGQLVFEPEEGSVVMEPSIKNKGSETCPLAEPSYVIKGSLAFQLNPENAEAETVKFSASGFTFIHVWQSAEQENEKIVELVHACEVVIFKVPEFPVKLKAGGTFGFTE